MPRNKGRKSRKPPKARKANPTLPTETLTQILSLVNEGQGPVERQLNRQRFERVCKGWFHSVDRWSDLAVTGTAGLRNVGRVFEADDDYSDEGGLVGPRVRALYFLIRPGAQSKVAAVIARVPNLRTLAIAAPYVEDVRSLGAVLPSKLALLAELRHFKLEGAELLADSIPK